MLFQIKRCVVVSFVNINTDWFLQFFASGLPRLKPNHNCPLYSNEGDTISCSCFVSDLGNPPGTLRWNNTSSNQLEYKNLQKSQTGIQSVCTLTWNNTVKQSVSYTLIVTCEFPTIICIYIFSSIVG